MEQIKVNSIDEAITKINSKILIKIYYRFKEYFQKEIIFSGNYNSIIEMLNTLQERVIESISDYFNDMKSEISDMRKEGNDVELLDLEFLTIPLKLKLFEVEFSSENLEKVIYKFEDVKKQMGVFKNLVKESDNI